MKVPSHEATTAQLGAIYPFAASRPLPCSAVFVGRDLHGGAFVYDPFELYANAALTNPNALVLGQIGRGKSAFVKSFLFREAALGRRIIVLDPKGEYGPLAKSLGSEPIRLGPEGSTALNPLQLVSRAEEDRIQRFRRQLRMITGFSEACLGRLLAPFEHTALEIALAELRRLDPPTLRDVVSALLSPSVDACRSVSSSVEEMRASGRDVAFELRRFVVGELGGMFDARTSSPVNFDGPALVFDLSTLYSSPALGPFLACLVACLGGTFSEGGDQSVFVIDEAWSVLANIGAARFLQSSWKLARARGVANLAVVHRLSDLSAAGSSDSEQRKLAEGLLADCETVVCYAQSSSEIDGLVDLLGLDPAQAEIVTRLRRGVALWKVGRRVFLVDHHLSRSERPIVDTDAAMAR